MESQPQNPEFRINPEKFHPWLIGAMCAYRGNMCLYSATTIFCLC